MTQPPTSGRTPGRGTPGRPKDRLADAVTDRVTGALGDFLPASAPERITRAVGDIADHLPSGVAGRIADALTPRDPATRGDQMVAREQAQVPQPAAGGPGSAPAPMASAPTALPRPAAAPGREQPSLAERAKATGQAVLITLGVILPLGWVVLPWTSSRTIAAWREGKRAATRFVAGTVAAAIQVALSIALFHAAERADAAEGVYAYRPLWWSLAAISAGMLLVTGVRLAWARLRTRRARQGRIARPKVDGSLFDSTEAGRRVEESLKRLSEYAPLYSDLVVGEQRVSDQITRVVELAHELFRRLGARGTEQRTRLAEVQYADILGKVALFACPDYLRDVVDHPELWHHPEQRVTEAAAAFDAVGRQLLENIRQANAATDLDFQVALASLNAITQDDEFAALYAGTPPS